MITTGRAPTKGRPKLWAYGYADLATFLGMTVGSLRIAVHEGRLDPSSLEELYRWRCRREGALARAARRSPADPARTPRQPPRRGQER